MADYTEYLPDVSLSSALNLFTIFILFLVFSVIAGIATYFIIKRLRFKYKIVIFEKIGGKYELSRKDRAMLVRLEPSGDPVFYLNRNRKHIPLPSLQTGRNTYWFAIREDGEWINIGLEDIDESMRKAKAKYLDKEMRYARVALQRNFRERYMKPSFWEKYGGLVAYSTLILVTGLMMYLLFDKYIEISGALSGAIEQSRQLMELHKQVLSALENIQSGGSGLRPA